MYIQQKVVILTGVISRGKTTLFNKICNANQKVAAGGQSVTQRAIAKSSAYGKGFRIVDTPGFMSDCYKVQRVSELICALQERPVNQIILVMKAERTSQMISNLKPIIAIYNRFKDLITIVVTHWDNFIEREAPEEVNLIKQEIIQKLNLFNIHSVLFVSKECTGESICSQIDDILNLSKERQIQINETEFYANFDLLEITEEIEWQLVEAKERIKTKFLKVSRCIQKLIRDYDESQVNIPEVMHALTIEIKKYANQFIEQFERDNSKLFENLYQEAGDQAFIVHVELKKELALEVKRIIDLAQGKMNTSSKHCLNFIKHCPYCNEIWIKDAICDSKIICGGGVDSVSENFKSQAIPKRYKFEFSESNITVVDLGEIQTVQQNKQGINTKYGCGKQLDWESLPPLKPEELKELLDPGILDFFTEVNEEWIKKRDEQSKKIHEQWKSIKIIEI